MREGSCALEATSVCNAEVRSAVPDHPQSAAATRTPLRSAPAQPGELLLPLKLEGRGTERRMLWGALAEEEDIRPSPPSGPNRCWHRPLLRGKRVVVHSAHLHIAKNQGGTDNPLHPHGEWRGSGEGVQGGMSPTTGVKASLVQWGHTRDALEAQGQNPAPTWALLCGFFLTLSF